MSPNSLEHAPPGTGATIATLWVSVAGIATYWFVFFSNLPTATWDTCFIVFEQAFPPADTILASSAATCAEALRRRHRSAVLWGLFASGGFCFLGAMGTSYNLQHGGYDLTLPKLAELCVNVFCVGLATWLATFSWRHRHALGA